MLGDELCRVERSLLISLAIHTTWSELTLGLSDHSTCSSLAGLLSLPCLPISDTLSAVLSSAPPRCRDITCVVVVCVSVASSGAIAIHRAKVHTVATLEPASGRFTVLEIP